MLSADQTTIYCNTVSSAHFLQVHVFPPSQQLLSKRRAWLDPYFLYDRPLPIIHVLQPIYRLETAIQYQPRPTTDFHDRPRL